MIPRLMLLVGVLALLFAAVDARRGGRRGGRRGHLGFGSFGTSYRSTKTKTGTCPMSLVCDIQSNDGINFTPKTCAEGSQCSVGPLTINATGLLRGKSFSVKFCDTMNADGQMQLVGSVLDSRIL